MFVQVNRDNQMEDREADLAAVEGVDDVHDLHVWTLTSGMHVATAHLVATTPLVEAVLNDARTVLRRDHGIEHATLQVEAAADQGCHELGW